MFWADIHLNEMNTLRRKLSTPSILISDVEPSQTILSRRSMNIKRDFIYANFSQRRICITYVYAAKIIKKSMYYKTEQQVFCKISEKMSKVTKIKVNL